MKHSKIQAAMRSLYRFAELKNLKAPEFLINNEREILNQYLSKLTAEEIFIFANNFNKYYQQQQIQATQEDEQMSHSLAQNWSTLN